MEVVFLSIYTIDVCRHLSARVIFPAVERYTT